MSKIKVLPSALANQIAAGEVIERPSSVVKELLENALDAGATNLQIEVNDAGIGLIKITDNGKGMEKDDLPLSIAAHATSKIAKLDDLFSVKTLGFRGEALASIASVSRLSISSSVGLEQDAHVLKAEGGLVKTISKTAHPKGTSIVVEDLFFNALSRRRFLRSAKTELMHIEAVVKRLAMSAFSLELCLIIDGKQTLKVLPATNEAAKKNRVAKLFGKPFMNEVTVFSAKTSEYKLSGFLGSPNYLRSQNDLQFLFVNGRMVRDKLLMHAIMEVYGPLLYPGRQATFLLFFSLPESSVDVNVHPTKHELRFYEPRQVHDFVTSVLKKHLHNASTVNAAAMLTPSLEGRAEAVSSNQTERAFTSSVTAKAVNANLSFLNTCVSSTQIIPLASPFVLAIINEQATVFNLAKFYKKQLKARLDAAFLKKPLAARPLLVPMSFQLAKPCGFSFNELKDYGFEIEPMGENELVLRAFPVLTPYLKLQEFLQELPKLNNEADLKEALLLAQTINWQTFSSEDKEALEHDFLNSPYEKNYGRALTKETLQELLCH